MPTRFKIAIIGKLNSGKTTLIERFLHGRFIKEVESTKGANFSVHEVSTKGKIYKLSIWDIGASDRKFETDMIYYKGLNGALIAIDLSTLSDNLEIEMKYLAYWVRVLRSLNKHIPIFIIGTKKDSILNLEDEVITRIKVVMKKYNIDEFIQTSSVTGENINDIFDILIEKLLFRPEITFSEYNYKAQAISYLQNIKDSINWNLFEKYKIYDSETIEHLITETYAGNMSSALRNLWFLLEKVIFYLYKKIRDDEEGSINVQLKTLKEYNTFPDRIYQQINSINYLRNYYLHVAIPENAHERFGKAIMNFSQIITWIYNNILLKEIEPIIENKSLISNIVNFDLIKKLQQNPRQILILEQFEVLELWNQFSYILKFKLNEALSIIYGPNGSGKTTILEIISLFSKGNLNKIFKINFKKLQFKFQSPKSNESYIVILKLTDNKLEIEVKFAESEWLKANLNINDKDFIIYLLNMYLNLNSTELWAISSKLENIKFHFPDHYKEFLNMMPIMEILFWIINNFSCYYIPAMRIEISVGDLYKFIDNINQMEQPSENALEEIKKEIIDNYITNKAHEFKDFYADQEVHINLFKEIINTLVYDKKLSININNEIQFLTKENEIIPLTTLSSGEKNIFIIYFESIFKIKDESLVLIDEPEISLHVNWQIAFLKHLLTIKNSNIGLEPALNFLISTHSPQIIDNKWNCTIELEKLNENE